MDVVRNTSPTFENRSVPGTNNTPQIKALADRGTDRVLKFYSRLDKHLNEHTFLVGNSFSIADITAMCAIDFSEYVGIKVPNDLAKLSEWKERVSSRPSAQA
jgi:glutathione S-transferase